MVESVVGGWWGSVRVMWEVCDALELGVAKLFSSRSLGHVIILKLNCGNSFEKMFRS